MNIRLMRGQVVVRELDTPPSAVLWTPEAGPRQVKTHRGVVLGLGPPARLTESPISPEVPHGFEVGDVVQFHFGAVGTQAARTRAWSDGKPAIWLAQPEVDAVWAPTDDDVVDAMQRLGLDTQAWAGDVRRRIAAALDTADARIAEMKAS